ncbi:hypothetical protein ACQPW1_27145 [Nocardia sp. CA-128927]|uniref:hypothetical protein n=1 Tax=Nocardia sp. CA-128927 TaxID=3239975 RepID=UPI003D9523E3
MSRTTPRTDRGSYPAARSVAISAWAVPVLIVGQFAMVAVIPVTVVLVGTFRDVRLRRLRCWAGALAAAYAVPLGIWIFRPDRAPSLSKDMNPLLAGLVVVAGVAVGVVHQLLRKRYGPDGVADRSNGRTGADASGDNAAKPAQPTLDKADQHPIPEH